MRQTSRWLQCAAKVVRLSGNGWQSGGWFVPVVLLVICHCISDLVYQGVGPTPPMAFGLNCRRECVDILVPVHGSGRRLCQHGRVARALKIVVLVRRIWGLERMEKVDQWFRGIKTDLEPRKTSGDKLSCKRFAAMKTWCVIPVSLEKVARSFCACPILDKSNTMNLNAAETPIDFDSPTQRRYRWSPDGKRVLLVNRLLMQSENVDTQPLRKKPPTFEKEGAISNFCRSRRKVLFNCDCRPRSRIPLKRQ